MLAIITTAASIVLVPSVCILVMPMRDAYARDDGRYANTPLHAWFYHLVSGKGLCVNTAVWATAVVGAVLANQRISH